MTINQTIRGSISVPSGSTTATIASVVMAKTDLRRLGTTSQYSGAGSYKMDVRIALAGTTSISATVGASGGSADVGYELTEYV